MTTTNMKNQFELADIMLSRQLHWIAAADGKIAPVFAIDAAMLGVLTALVPPTDQWSIGESIFASLAVILLMGSIVCLTLGAFPRLGGPKESLTFFRGIASLSESGYLKRMRQGINQGVIDDLFRQIYRNAEIAVEKFDYIKWAMITMFGSVPFWLVAVALMY